MRRAAIAFVIPSLLRGGTEGQLLEMLRRLDRSVFDLRLVLFEHPQDSHAFDGMVSETFVLHTSPSGNSAWVRRGPQLLLAWGKLIRYFRTSRPDVVHGLLPAAGILGCSAARMAGVPVTIVSRRSMLECYRKGNWILAGVDWFSLNFADVVIGNSAAVTEDTAARDRVPRHKMVTIYNGVDTVWFTPGPGDEMRRSLGWTEEHVVFGMVAHFREGKGHLDLVAAAGLLYRKFPMVRFLMVGSDQGTLTQVLQEIRGSCLEGIIRVVPGTATPQELYRAMDIHICASETEGLPNVLLEAMATAKPVIATRVGGNAEVVCHDETGFLVPVRDPLAMAAAGERLLANPSLRRRMGRCARDVVESRFSLDRMVRSHEELYLRLLGAKSPITYSPVAPRFSS